MIIALVIFLIAVFSGYVSFLSAKPTLVDNSKRGFKRFTNDGKKFIASTFLLIILPLILYIIQMQNDATKESQTKKEQEAYAQRIIEKISSTAAIYHLQWDSVSLLLNKLRDSLKGNTIVQNSPENPVLEITNSEESHNGINYSQPGISIYEHKNNYYSFLVNIMSRDASSSSFNTKTSIFVSDSFNAVKYVGKENLIRDKIRLAKGETLNPYFAVPDSLNFEVVYLWIRGTYKDGEMKKSYNIDEAYYYNVRAKRFGTVVGDWKKTLIKSASRHEK